MKKTKNILRIFAFTGSLVLFLLMYFHFISLYPDKKYIDDFFTLSIFSAILLVGFKFNKKIINIIVSICSFWLTVSSVFHLITKNYLTPLFVIISLINIAAFVIFFIAMSEKVFNETPNISNNKLNAAAAVLLTVSAVILLASGNFYAAAVSFFSLLLLLSCIFESPCNLKQLKLIQIREVIHK